jgi:hypothetical protein
MTRNAHQDNLLAQGLAAFAQSLDPGQAPQSFDWVGGAGGNGDWNTAKDWSPAQVPDASASATFATGLFGYTVTGDATIGSIFVNGDGVTFDGVIDEDTGGPTFFLNGYNGADLTLDSNSFVTGQEIDMAQGTLLDVQGGLITTGGYADVAIVEGLDGQMIVANTVQLNQLYVQTGGSYAGNVTLNDNGSITLDTSSSFGGGTVTLLGTGTIYAASALGNGGFIGIGEDIVTYLSGTFLNLAADPNTTLQIGGTISGDGNLIINGGTVELTAVDSYTGFTDVQDGATLQVDQPGGAPGVVFLDTGAYTNLADGQTYSQVVVASSGSDTIDAAGGGLLVFGGGASSLNFVGGSAPSTVIGGSGVLDATAGSGDLIFGGTSGQDQIYSGNGNATLVGGMGASLYADGAGNVVLVAGGTGVTADASQDTGNVTVFGAANDAIEVLGGAGNVTAIVNNSDATVYAGPGTMTVFSGAASLALDYVVGFGGGMTDVVGFNTASDMINLFGYANGTAQQALASETVAGGNTYLALSDNTRIDLFGVTNLTMANFTSV